MLEEVTPDTTWPCKPISLAEIRLKEMQITAVIKFCCIHPTGKHYIANLGYCDDRQW
jgi:hypothetical protein